WDELDPKPALTGNTSGSNAVIAGFTAFNLIASLTVGPAFLARVHLTGEPWAQFFVTLFPLLFSALFFAVPTARWVVERRRTRKRAGGRLRRELLREIWGRPGGTIDPALAARAAAERAGLEEAEGRKLLDRLAADLDADIDADQEGRVRYRFPRVAEERRAV